MKFLSIHLLVFRLLRDSAGRSSDYLDPGTGSVILQVILGGVAGVGVIAKMYWHRIAAYIPGRSRSTDDVAETE